MKGYIYKFENKENHKTYIGQTIRKIKIRYNEHLRASEKELDNFPIHKAIRKYGINSFIFEIIEEVEFNNKDILINKLNKLEIYYIEKYNSLVPNGYNILSGGNNFCNPHISQKDLFWKDESVLDRETGFIYENTYEWLISCNLPTEEQYNLYMNKNYRYRLVNYDKILYRGECIPKDSTIKDIFEGKAIAVINFSNEFYENLYTKVSQNTDDLNKLKQENRQMKAQIEELRKQLNAKTVYTI